MITENTITTAKIIEIEKQLTADPDGGNGGTDKRDRTARFSDFRQGLFNLDKDIEKETEVCTEPAQRSQEGGPPEEDHQGRSAENHPGHREPPPKSRREDERQTGGEGGNSVGRVIGDRGDR